MKYIKSEDVIDELSAHRLTVFDINEITKIYKKPRHYVSKSIARIKKIQRIERGKYFLVGASEYAIASNIVYPSYISLLSAFKYYGLTEQEPVVFSVISLKRHNNVAFNRSTIEFIALKHDRFFGYAKKDGAFIAEPEKSIIDALYLNRPAYSYVSDALHEGLVSKAL